MTKEPEDAMSRLSFVNTTPSVEDLKDKIAELIDVIAAKDKKIAEQEEDMIAQDKEISRLTGELDIANEIIDLNLTGIRVLPSRPKDKLNKTFPPTMVDVGDLDTNAIKEELEAVKGKAVADKLKPKDDVRTWRYGAIEDEWFALEAKIKSMKVEAEKEKRMVDRAAVAKLKGRQKSLENTIKEMDTNFMCNNCWGVEGKTCDGCINCSHCSSENKPCEWSRWMSIFEEGMKE
ncbi:uncharacterized protein K452DRAFT_334896 [Aplosporella prunicola CBS 121167]|uniref:Uncharacterized protein n=1 Tax=Aplosporella prunicola CBS 121167 TaxID=1176127 RepID=A0A6A6BAA8_9PEZI|nr:uncharacterized protein K452DRAFT_334896 [Aplosporella prunicola CBS 121167]KAF2140518.1 hypothetical protein K452DRAFT_334896 [Aplosporella prunicola CBS 121167]